MNEHRLEATLLLQAISVPRAVAPPPAPPAPKTIPRDGTFRLAIIIAVPTFTASLRIPSMSFSLSAGAGARLAYPAWVPSGTRARLIGW